MAETSINFKPNMRAMARNWGMLVLRGVLALLFGILVLLFPFTALEILVLFFGAYVFVDGLFAIVGALQHRSQ